jgi:hypothetical protein
LFLISTISKYAPSSKITQTCFFLSYYSLLIIWHAVQCFWFQTSVKCTRKWRNCWNLRILILKTMQSETNLFFDLIYTHLAYTRMTEMLYIRHSELFNELK